jgi:phosphoglucosamine mutase
MTVAELAGVMRRFPQVMRNVRVADKERLAGAADVWEAARASEAELGDAGRVLVRASGTEPLVRVMVEADSEEAAAEHVTRIARAVEAVLG